MKFGFEIGLAGRGFIELAVQPEPEGGSGSRIRKARKSGRLHEPRNAELRFIELPNFAKAGFVL